MDGKKTKEKFFYKVYDQTYYNLKKYVRRRSADSSLVDDILQEVYLEVFRHIEDLQTHENYVGWIYKTAENKVKKVNSIYNNHVANEIVCCEETMENIAVEDREPDYIVYEDLKNILMQDEYELLMKKYVVGYSHKELADMTGNTLAGNKMRISRIIKKLKQNFLTHIFLIIFF